MIAQTIGATINAYTCWRATLPMNKAGAKLCAGLTEVPVNGVCDGYFFDEFKFYYKLNSEFFFISILSTVYFIK